MTQLLKTISSQEFLESMKNGTYDEVREAVLDAIDPFFEKFTGFDHEMVVRTMPAEIVDWVKQTTILFFKLSQRAKDMPRNEAPE